MRKKAKKVKKAKKLTWISLRFVSLQRKNYYIEAKRKIYSEKSEKKLKNAEKCEKWRKKVKKCENIDLNFASLCFPSKRKLLKWSEAKNFKQKEAKRSEKREVKF